MEGLRSLDVPHKGITVTEAFTGSARWLVEGILMKSNRKRPTTSLVIQIGFIRDVGSNSSHALTRSPTEADKDDDCQF